MTKFLLSPLIIVGTAALLSCSTHRDVVPLSEYQAMVDSISKSTGSDIYVDSFMYRRFPVLKENLWRDREALLKSAKDTCALHTVERRYESEISPIWHSPRGTMDKASKKSWTAEYARRDKRNRVSWKEFVKTMRDSLPDWCPPNKKEWKRQCMTRAEMQQAIANNKRIGKMLTGTFMLERDSAGHIHTRRVTDSVELAKIKARHYRWNSVANGMLGAAHTDEPYVGLMFGAEGYRLSDTEHLWLKVDVGHCHPFPSAKPTCKVYDYGTYVKVKEPDGQEETIYIKVRDPHFRLLQNPPFKYTFTANFEYAGRWYYVYLCDDPLKCVCKPIDTRQKDFPEL